METTIMENQMEKKMENEMEYIEVIYYSSFSGLGLESMPGHTESATSLGAI